MAKNIEISELANSIAKELANYSAAVEVVVDKETRKLAKQITNELENDQSIPKSDADTKHYRDSFYMRKYGAKSKKRGYIIANKIYQRTHLLEFGHVTRNGGRTQAFPHWEQANRKAQTLAINIRKRLESGVK